MPEERVLSGSLAIVGSEDLVSGLRALGFQVYAVKGKEQAEAALSESVYKGIAVCLVQEDIYTLTRERIGSFKDLPLPVFVPFAKDNQTELLEEIVRDIRLRATGKLY